MIEISGLDELTRKLNDLASRAKALDGTHEVPIEELLTPAFLQNCSSFGSVDDLFAASGFRIESPEDFKAIPDDKWNSFIADHTSHSTWESMLSSASAAWTSKRLGF